MKIYCPYCNSSKTQKRGQFPKQKYQCRTCFKYFYGEKSIAKVLMFDIETLPGEKYFWHLGEQDWNPESIIRDWCVLSYSAKWLFDSESKSSALTPKEALAHNDERLVKEIHQWFNEADVIVAHNGDAFDLSKMNTRYLYYDLPPSSHYLSIDTFTTAKKAFGFTSNKLAYLAKYLGLNPKIHTDYDLWVRCAHGDKKAIEYMRIYNEQDIYTLEEVYVRMRPWIRHPNMALYVDTDKIICPVCTSDSLDWKGTYKTPANVFDSFRCNNCGALGRTNKGRKGINRSRSVLW